LHKLFTYGSTDAASSTLLKRNQRTMVELKALADVVIAVQGLTRERPFDARTSEHRHGIDRDFG
jgi:hypothetical protein